MPPASCAALPPGVSSEDDRRNARPQASGSGVRRTENPDLCRAVGRSPRSAILIMRRRRPETERDLPADGVQTKPPPLRGPSSTSSSPPIGFSHRDSLGGRSVSIVVLDVLEAVVDRWNRSSVNYAVANGLEGYPERLGRDIDVVVDRRHLRGASAAVCSVFEQHGWRVVVLNYREVVQHIGIGRDGNACLFIDLFPGLRWGPVWLVKQPAEAAGVDGFRVDPWTSFVKRILLHVLVAPAAKFSGRPDRLHLSAQERSAASIRLPLLLGAELADRLRAAVEQQDVVELEALRPRLRKALIVGSFREAPLRAMRTTAQWAAMRVTFATARPVMPTLSIIGLDDVDRTPLLAEVARQARERLRCPRVAVRHWRPGMLPRIGKYFAKTSPERTVVTQDMPGRPGPVRTAYYAVDFFLGHFVLDRRESVDLGLVVYEGGALDHYVNPLHGGAAPGWITRLLLRVLPQPDLIVLLQHPPDGPPGQQPTGQEEEIDRRLDLWMRSSSTQLAHMVVHTDRDPRVPAERIISRLVDLLVRGNSARMA
jgi:hypothetical protein